MEIVFIRHGESEGNALNGADQVYTGQWDCDLTDRGRMQAAALKNDPVLADVDRYFVSDLKRARSTAHEITEQEPVIDSRLRERSLGDFEGRKIEDIRNSPEYAKYFSDAGLMTFRHSFTAKAPGGENYSDVCRRVRSFLRDLSKSGYNKVVIVAHFISIRCLIKETSGLSEEETLAYPVPNCSPISVVWDGHVSKD